jgi:ERF superfamily
MDTLLADRPVQAAPQYPAEIVKAISQIMATPLYIQKTGRNEHFGYRFAKVGDVLDMLQPKLAKAGLVIFQSEEDRSLIGDGAVLCVKYRFTLAHTSSAVWPESFFHTGMSAARHPKGGWDDKACNKCHTAARKYFLLALFQVPTGEDYREPLNDGDADEHGPVPAPQEAPPVQHAPPPAPAVETRPEPPRKAKISPQAFWDQPSLTLAPSDKTTVAALIGRLRKAIPEAPTVELLDKLFADQPKALMSGAMLDPAWAEVEQARRLRWQSLMEKADVQQVA